MRTLLLPKYTWTDTQLTAAVGGSACWRDVLRALGIPTNSAGVVRRVKRDATRLQLDVSHFKGTRTWDDLQLARAVGDARSWDDVCTALGLRTARKETRVRVAAHAMRLGLDLRHLDVKPPRVADGPAFAVDPLRLRDCATSIAAAWFTVRGCVVSLPDQQATYDLLVDSPADGILGVQVKSSTHKPEEGRSVTVGHRPYALGNLAPLMPYDPEVIHFFFILDGDYNMYLIPSRVIAGRVGILLRTYTQYIVGNASGLLGASPTAAEAEVPPAA